MFYNRSIVAFICLHVIHLGKSTVRMPIAYLVYVSKRGAGAVMSYDYHDDVRVGSRIIPHLKRRSKQISRV